MDISEQQLHELITCPKDIISKPRKEFLCTNGCRRNDFTGRIYNLSATAHSKK